MSASFNCPPWYWNPNLGQDVHAGTQPFPPMTSVNRLPKLMGRVAPGQAQALYQLYKSSDGAGDRQAAKRVHFQATGWTAPSYMDRSTNPAVEPFSRHSSSKPRWSPADSIEALEPEYGSFAPRNPHPTHANDGFLDPEPTPWNAWERWTVY